MRIKMKKINKIHIVCLVVLLFNFIFNLNKVFASDSKVDFDKVNFTISYIDMGKKIEGVNFRVYKIGNIDENNDITLTKAFESYPLGLNKSKENEWNEYANTLKGYVDKDKQVPSFEGKTDKDGLINLKLEKGLYFVAGDDLFTDKYKYTTSPFVVRLPEFDKETDNFLGETLARPKFIRKDFTNGKIDIDILKVWDDKGYENQRPEFVEVDLLENNKVKDSVKLNKDNNWTYVWKGLDLNNSWDVVEKNVDKEKYKVKVKKENNSLVITNVYIPAKEQKPEKPQTIPFTGQLWWPVYLLSGIGILSILLAYVKEKRKGKANEK